jgi:drug/metabolite transporter (DMT)-like permease
MNTANITRLILLAAIWGGSYALMRVVAPVFGGWDTALLRVLIAGAALVGFAMIVRADLQWRRWWKQYLFVGLFNSAIPFALISHAMKTLPAGYGAIINSLSPFFGMIFAAILLSERITWPRIVGLLLGLGGVFLLVNLGPIAITPSVIIGVLCCTLATLSYGFISVWVKKHVTGAPPLGIAGAALLLSGLAMTPVSLTLGSHPTTMPPLHVWIALLALALVCSAIAYLLYFRLIKDLGPTKAISVTFLIPFFGVLWGAIFFDERLTLGAAAGGALVLIGMTLVLGLWPRPLKADTSTD